MQGTKILFRIQVHKVTFPKDTAIAADAEGILFVGIREAMSSSHLKGYMI